MRHFSKSAGLASVLNVLALTPSFADMLPTYSSIGSVNTAGYTFKVQQTGTVTAYFAGASASLTDTLSIFDNGTLIVPSIFDNHTTALGTSASLAVKAGDALSFSIVRTDGTTFSSNPTQNADLAQHVYSTSFSSSGDGSLGYGLAAGQYTYVGFEDRAIPGEFSGGTYYSSDMDYNDTSFLFSNTAVSSVPLPAGLLLFGGALLALAGLTRGWKGWAARTRQADAG